MAIARRPQIYDVTSPSLHPMYRKEENKSLGKGAKANYQNSTSTEKSAL